MAYASMPGSGYGATASVIPNAHGDTISVPDAELLFNGDFRRAGPDLVLTGPDGRHHLVPGYFSGAKKALVAPNGASLSPDVVDLLAGSPAPGQYAQAQPTTPADAIGKVEKAIGNVTAIRNGVAVALHVGDPVFKSDIVQTGANSSAGIGFPDGTALNLIANTRMALNDYSYDPNGTSNVALVSLVQGTFAFVAGRVAHTGDMKIETPVATMGIRGTTGWVQEIASVTANLGNVSYSFAVVDDFNSTGHGQYDLIDANGNIIATVSQTGYVTYVTPQGIGQAPLVSTEPMSNSQLGFEQQIIQQVFGVLNSLNNPNPNPQSTPGTPGSSTPPNQLNELPHLLQEGNGQQFAVNIPVPGPSGTTNVSGTVTIDTTPPPQQTTENNSPTATVSWTSTSGGDWSDAANWSDDATPQGSQNVDITQPVKVTIDGVEEAASLVIGAGGILNIIAGGEFGIAGGISNSGVLQLNSSGGDPQLVIDGTVYLLGGGTIEFKGPAAQNVVTGLAGSGATLVNVDNTIEGSGAIGAGDGALTLVNGSQGTIDATLLVAGDSGALTIDTGNTVSNSGLLEATANAFGGGTLQIEDNVTNNGAIEAVGNGATVELFAVMVSGGIVETSGGGVIETAVGTGASSLASVTVADGTTLEAAAGTTLHLSGTTTLDGGLALYSDGTGSFKLASGDQIVAASGASAALENFGTISGAGQIGSGDLTLTVQNETSSAVIDADVAHQTLTIDTANGNGNSNTLLNVGTLEATNNGELSVHAVVNNFGGQLDADGGFIDFLLGITGGNATVSDGGKLEYGWSSNVDTGFNGAGTLVLDHQNQAYSNFATVSYTGTVTGFGTNDVIVLADLVWTSTETASWDNGTLTISDGGQTEAAIQVSGSYSANSFSVADDGGEAEVELATSPPPPTSDEWTNTSGGSWSDPDNWSNGVPTSTSNVVIDLPGTYRIAISGTEAANSLTVSDADATLKLEGAGTLTVGTFVNDGTVEAGHGAHFTVDEQGDGSTDDGTIETRDGGKLTIDHGGSAVNEADGTIESLGHGSSLILNNNVDDENLGTIEAARGGTLTVDVANSDDTVGTGGNFGKMEAVSGGSLFVVGDFINGGDAGDGTIEAVGPHSLVEFSDNTSDPSVTDDKLIDNNGAIVAVDYGHVWFDGGSLEEGLGIDDDGVIKAADHGKVSFDFVELTNESTGRIEAVGKGSSVDFSYAGINDLGTMVAEDGGTMVLKDVVFNTQSGGLLKALDGGTIIADIENGSWNSGTEEAADRGTIVVDILGSDTGNTGTIEAIGSGTIVINLDHAVYDPGLPIGGNMGTIKAVDGGTVRMIGLSNNEAQGTLEAVGFGASLIISDGGVQNEGVIAAKHNGIVSIENSTIYGGTLEADGGTIFVSSDSTVNGSDADSASVFVANGGIAHFADQIGANGTVNVTFGTGGEGAHDGFGTLELDAAPGSDLVVNNFNVGDTIDLTALNFSSNEQPSFSDGVLSVSVPSGQTISIDLDGSYQTSDFTLLSDPSGGTEVVFGAADTWQSHNGDWNDPGNWSAGLPGEDSTAIVVTSGSVVTVDDHETVGNLVVGQEWESGQLDIVPSGSLVVLNALDDSGTITVDGEAGSTAYFEVDGPARVEASGSVISDGGVDTAVFSHDQVGNAGEISAECGGVVNFYGATVTNYSEGTITAASGGTVDLDYSAVGNAGTLRADHGTLDISHTTFTQSGDGAIAAAGWSGAVDLDDAAIIGGTLKTDCNGVIQTVTGHDGEWTVSTFDGVTIACGSGVLVNDGTSLILEDTIANHGTITVGTQTLGDPDLVIENCVTLTGHGDIVLSGGDDNIVGGSDGGTLDNVNNNISGGGTIGGCDLALVNESCGVVDADQQFSALTLDTGSNSVHNSGLLEATAYGDLTVKSFVDNACGTIEAVSGGYVQIEGGISGGQATIADGTLEFDGCANIAAAFSSGLQGALVLGADSHFTGSVSGFAAGDAIDLQGINYSDAQYIYCSSNNTLTVQDGTDGPSQTIQLEGTGYCQSSFALFDDGTGHAAITVLQSNPALGTEYGDSGNYFQYVSDPTATWLVAQAGAVSAGGFLATIDSADENSFVQGLTGGHSAWLGGSDLLSTNPDHTANWYWVAGPDGGPMTYTNWNDSTSDEPNNLDHSPYDVGEHFLQLLSNGQWNDEQGPLVESAARTDGYVIETVGGGVSYDPMVVPGTSDVVGYIAFTDPSSGDALTATATPEGSNYIGNFVLDPVSESGGTATLDFQFDLGSDQINLSPGQTLTQSYDVSVADGQHTLVDHTVSVTIGGPGNDNFVFAPGIGTDTIVNFDAQADTIDLSHFANIQSLQQVAAAITTDAHGDAVIELGHNDSITLPGVTANYLQQHLQSMVHVHA